MEAILRYCPLHLLDDALAAGWELVADFQDCHHGAYSAGLVEWRRDEPVGCWPPIAQGCMTVKTLDQMIGSLSPERREKIAERTKQLITE